MFPMDFFNETLLIQVKLDQASIPEIIFLHLEKIEDVMVHGLYVPWDTTFVVCSVWEYVLVLTEYTMMLSWDCLPPCSRTQPASELPINQRTIQAHSVFV